MQSSTRDERRVPTADGSGRPAPDEGACGRTFCPAYVRLREQTAKERRAAFARGDLDEALGRYCRKRWERLGPLDPVEGIVLDFWRQHFTLGSNLPPARAGDTFTEESNDG